MRLSRTRSSRRPQAGGHDVAGLSMRTTLLLFSFAAAAWLMAYPASAQVKASVAANTTPPWNKGIQPISRESYWSAMECGKQGGANPPCVFYDTGFCKNEEFTLALYTPYKFVAYSVWQAVSQKREPPTPSYAEAQRTRVVLGVRPLRRQNPIAAVQVRRGGKTVQPATKTLDGGGGTFIFDFAPFAPSSSITIDLVGKARTITCQVDRSVLARMR
jgi:hypothetical protein